MSPHRSGQNHVRMPDIEFEELLARAAEEGAKRALADVGLDGKEAALDIRDLRALLDAIRFVRRTAVQSAVQLITTGLILALLAGIALKMKVFGEPLEPHAAPFCIPHPNPPLMAGFFLARRRAKGTLS